MPKILNEELTGRIKELHKEHNLEFYTTDNLVTAEKWIKQIGENVNNSIAIDIETSGFDGVRNDMLGIVIAVSLKKSIYVITRNFTDAQVRKLIKQINDLKNIKIAHNMFFDCSFIKLRYKIDLKIDKDTMIYAYCLYTHRVYYNEGIGLKDLAREFTPYGDYEDELQEYKRDFCKKNKIKIKDFSYDLFPDSILSTYAHLDGLSTIYLYNIFEKTKIKFIKEGWHKLDSLLDIKHKVTYIYIEMSVSGFKVNREKVFELKEKWEKDRDSLEKELMSLPEIKIAEKIIFRDILSKSQSKRKSLLPLSRCRKLKNENKFNLNSNAHKKILFYDVLKLEVIDKTPKGEPGTGTSVITHYAEKGNEFMVKLDRYTRLTKGITAFIGNDEEKGLLGFTTDDHPYVHPNYNHCGMVSSRTACNSPNLLQIPSRGELKEIKKCFEVDEGRNLYGFDYMAAEVRIVTALSQEPNFTEAVINNWDFHSNTVYNVFKDKINIPEELRDKKDILDYIKDNYKLLRQYSKATLFGLIYGIKEVGLSKNIGTTKKEAKEIIDSFFENNKVLKEYLDGVLKNTYKNGYVENDWGMRLYLRNVQKFNPFSKSKNKNYTALAEYRLANNFPIQSGNAFILYEALIKFDNKIKELNLDVKYLTSIYDALYLDISNKVDISLVVKLLKECFEIDYRGIKMGIDISGSNDRTWYSWENDDLNNL